MSAKDETKFNNMAAKDENKFNNMSAKDENKFNTMSAKDENKFNNMSATVIGDVMYLYPFMNTVYVNGNRKDTNSSLIVLYNIIHLIVCKYPNKYT
jgi:uncharacterized membrane protein